ncbi:MAG: alpha-1,2-fucosyltransferase [Butyrivibrio sp.]|nr:alpha-1,2-fucosyltransferase [Butyrivibrio sp.]
MIYSQATGGFGNQLYNYAIGFALAQQYGESFTLDISPYKFSPRPFVLDQLTISGNIAYLFPPKKDTKLSRMTARILRIIATNRYGLCRWLKESPSTRNQFGSYDFSHKASLYLEGYWQHYRYFDSYHDLLCKEFQLKEEFISEQCRHLIQQVQAEDSVAVHIRRGDYEAAWLLNDDYYHNAFAFISSKLKNPRYYIFCEDIPYIKEHYGYLTNAVFVTGSFSLSDMEEFWLMSKCRHQIIANSTFSWWAAYLNTTSGKIVVAPEYMHWNKEYYPSGWNVLQA